MCIRILNNIPDEYIWYIALACCILFPISTPIWLFIGIVLLVSKAPIHENYIVIGNLDTNKRKQNMTDLREQQDSKRVKYDNDGNIYDDSISSDISSDENNETTSTVTSIYDGNDIEDDVKISV